MQKKRNRCLYVADYLISPDQRIENGAVLCENDKILAVGGISGFSKDEDLTIRHFPNAYITPGFIDVHIYGAGGFDCSSVASSPRTLADMSRLLGERGVTGFFPTVVADSPEVMLANLSALTDEMAKPLPGADALGISIEGPFINPLKCGSQKPEFLSEVDLNFASELIAASRGRCKKMTFAPELRHSDKLIELLLQHGVVPSMSNSVADELQTGRAIDAGACLCTHLFNGMLPLHQRDLSLASVALVDDRVTVELIIDGMHIHPRMVDLTCRCKPADRIIGVSDCTMAAGMPPGEYMVGPARITVRDRYSQTLDGTLAGTTTMLDTGMHGLMSSGHLEETISAQAVTRNPAYFFGFRDRGMLLPNRRADLAVFECVTNRPLMTVRSGEVIYHE